MNLYEITGAEMALQAMLESGEIDEQAYSDTIDGLNAEGKIENIIHVIKNLEAHAAACKEQKDIFAAKQKAAENGVQRLKDSILQHMQALDKKKVDAGLFTVSKSVSKSVEIFKEDALDEKYFIPQPPKIDKTAISNDIKAGIDVTGAQIIEKPYIRIK